jgi:hypothetical protein
MAAFADRDENDGQRPLEVVAGADDGKQTVMGGAQSFE